MIAKDEPAKFMNVVHVPVELLQPSSIVSHLILPPKDVFVS